MNLKEKYNIEILNLIPEYSSSGAASTCGPLKERNTAK